MGKIQQKSASLLREIFIKIHQMVCVHNWAHSKRVNLGIDIFAEKVCIKCRKKAYLPYSGGDRYYDIKD